MDVCAHRGRKERCGLHELHGRHLSVLLLSHHQRLADPVPESFSATLFLLPFCPSFRTPSPNVPFCPNLIAGQCLKHQLPSPSPLSAIHILLTHMTWFSCAIALNLPLDGCDPLWLTGSDSIPLAWKCTLYSGLNHHFKTIKYGVCVPSYK